MILSTTFMDHTWLSRLSERRFMEGPETTRPWAILLIEDQDLSKTNLKFFNNDKVLKIPQYLLPDHDYAMSKIKDDLSEVVVKFIGEIYQSPAPYWAVTACETGNSKSGAIAKWISDMCLVPIKSMYPGHNIDTSRINRKIYNALDPNLLTVNSFEFTF